LDERLKAHFGKLRPYTPDRRDECYIAERSAQTKAQVSRRLAVEHDPCFQVPHRTQHRFCERVRI
jgi:hypothetical protein